MMDRRVFRFLDFLNCPIIQNIVRPKNLDYISAPIVKEIDKYFTYWNSKGEELFSDEKLDPQFILDRYKDVTHITEDEIRQVTSDQWSTYKDIRYRNTLT